MEGRCDRDAERKEEAGGSSFVESPRDMAEEEEMQGWRKKGRRNGLRGIKQ